MKILKFGGTSVGSPERIQKVIEIIKGYKNSAVVVSAFGGVTDKLIDVGRSAAEGSKAYKKMFQEIEKQHITAVKKLVKNPAKTLKEVRTTLKELEEVLRGINLIKEVSKRTLDLVMSFGERLSAYIIAQSLNAEFLDSRLLIKTDENFGYAKIQVQRSNKNIQEYFKKHKRLQIITGFIATTDLNETTTLGRGGSDYTASFFAAALKAEEIEIWTDVDGIMTADPRKVKKAFSIPNISYQEAMEMSHFGAKVIHPPTMQPALSQKIPIRIKNTLNPSFEGSVISKEKCTREHIVKGISSISNVALLRLEGGGMVGVAGVAKRLFESLANENISVILISQASSEHSICFAIDEKLTKKAKKVIEEEFSLEIQAKQVRPVSIEKGVSIIAIVGENMRNTPGVSGKLFQALGKNGVNIVATAQGSSELNISTVISEKDESKALRAIHNAFFLSEVQSLHLFMIGTGLIGSTLLSQIEKERRRHLRDQHLDIKIIGLANSKKMLFEEDGIKLENWQSELKKSKKTSDVRAFTEEMNNLNLPNSVFVDCTSSEQVTKEYPKILKDSISIVTPNKKACSAKMQEYLKLSLAASKSNAKFLFETNVGAGLPILSTLNDLMNSGDQILRIEAVLSGTLSYIFNSFTGEKKFSEVVKEAKEKGYTEPDPRDDLNGLDVARKLLILARESGYLLDLDDIKVENLVPENCRKAKDVNEFFEELEKSEDYFSNKLKDAQAENKKLCYIATLHGNKARIRLTAIDQSHPFYNLSGSDNIISFTTNRYSSTPLVVKGPGAGAQVTAAGVFADILKTSNTSFDRKLMRTSFLQKIKSKNLQLSLIGMSNMGKTFWSKRLTKLGFKHICCDDLIEDKLGPVLKERGYRGLKDVAKWLGHPYENQFEENQKKYMQLENTVMKNIFEEIKSPKENIVIDTTGSVIYTSKENLEKLKKNTLVVYLESSKQHRQKMYKNFLSHPKPIIWDRLYRRLDEESEEEALARCYNELLEYRSALYKKHADIVIPYHEIEGYKLNEKQFMALIEEKL